MSVLTFGEECRECMFWAETHAMQGYNNKCAQEDREGECRAHPPVLSDRCLMEFQETCKDYYSAADLVCYANAWVFPVTKASGWCGEFRRE